MTSCQGLAAGPLRVSLVGWVKMSTTAAYRQMQVFVWTIIVRQVGQNCKWLYTWSKIRVVGPLRDHDVTTIQGPNMRVILRILLRSRCPRCPARVRTEKTDRAAGILMAEYPLPLQSVVVCLPFGVPGVLHFQVAASPRLRLVDRRTT